jgi:hypothetical protein
MLCITRHLEAGFDSIWREEEDEEKVLCDENSREAVITKYRFGSIL